MGLWLLAQLVDREDLFACARLNCNSKARLAPFTIAHITVLICRKIRFTCRRAAKTPISQYFSYKSSNIQMCNPVSLTTWE